MKTKIKRKDGTMYYLNRAVDETPMIFDSIKELKEYIELVHAEEGDWDWIGNIHDDQGNEYACEWSLEIVKL